MSFDAGFLHALSGEIREELSDARLERIFQCTRDTFVFEFRAAKKPRALFVNAGPSGGLCYLTERKIAHPDTPPMFCMLLRKHLCGGRFLTAEQIGFERVLKIDIEFFDAFGSPLLRTLYLEAMGKNSNLILCDDKGVILGALRTLDLAQSPDRPLLVGMRYTPPAPRSGAYSLIEADLADKLRLRFTEVPPEGTMRSWLIQTVSGIGPALAREIVFRAAGDTEAEAEKTDFARLCGALAELQARLKRGEYRFTAYYDESGDLRRPVEYSFVEMTQYAGMASETFSSPSRLLDAVAGEKEAHERLHTQTRRAESVLKAAVRRLEKKLDAQQSDLSRADGCEELKKCGDLITQEIYRLRRGDTLLSATDWESGETLQVSLDARLTPAANAQRYYKQYQKQKRARALLREQIAETREELSYAESIREALERVESVRDAAEICREVSEWDYGKRFSKGEAPARKKRAQDTVEPSSDVSPSGFAVLVGKNNLQNEKLTFSIAAKQDLWFHVKGRPGPHVILHIEGDRTVTEADLEFAARLALPSGCRTVGWEVDYTRVRFVRHHPSGLPGRVTYTGEKTVFVR